MPPVGSIDVGSNAIRFAVGELNGSGRLKLIHSQREPIRIGQDVFGDGDISDLTIRRIEEAFAQFIEIGQKHGSRALRAVATSAFREAKNQQSALERIRKDIGVPIEVIPGEEEARLIHLAVANRLPLADQLALLIDIGGGSVEVTIADHGDVISSESAPMGTVRLLKMLEDKKRSAKAVNSLIRNFAKGIKQQIAAEIADRTFDVAVGTGGNIECLGELGVSICKAKSHELLSTEHLEMIVEKLQGLSYDERVSELNLRPDRADVIFPAATVLLQVLQQAKIKELVVPNVGLKDGIIIDMLYERSDAEQGSRRHQLVGFAKELGRKYDYDEVHGVQVSNLALQLFDQTKELHELDKKWRLLLELGALLHDIGQFVNYNGHHKHSYYLIHACPFVGLTTREQGIVASIARYHRKSAPKLEHESFARLDNKDRQPVTMLAAILRIADALDRQHAANVTELAVKLEDKQLIVRVRSAGDMLLETWAVQKKSKLFQDVFAKEVVVEAV